GVEGIYLVTIAPTEAREGVAPVLGTASESTTCKHRVRVEAVEFHLTAIGEPYVLASDLADPNRRRNRVAYKFLGDAVRGSWVRDPFGVGERPGPLLDQLPDRLLGPCEVPLALLHWTLADGITFVDAWSVRRRPSGPPARGEGAWVLGGNSVAEGEARFLQFQDQIRDMSRSSSPGGITASDGFETLPSAGLLPLKSARFPRGFDRSWFPASMTRRGPVHLNGARLQELVRHSFAYPPVRLDSREFFCLYLLRENQPAVGTTPEVQECLVFASGHLPMVAEPRLNLSYWNLSNYL
ncbi:MAG: hypothetical protein JNL97_07180, partial [Verrucomicrobiales bacterium]|nr:hypothetical protein [Verrucomicrobiales bacterium]